MEKTGVQKLAGVLKVLVTITIGCNLLALFLVPGLALLKGFAPLLGLTPYETALELPARVWMVFVTTCYLLSPLRGRRPGKRRCLRLCGGFPYLRSKDTKKLRHPPMKRQKKGAAGCPAGRIC